MNLPQYKAYKDSGISWIGTIPAHWNSLRIKTLFELMKRPPRDEDGVVTAFRDGEVTLRTNRRTDGFTNSLQEIGYQGVRRGDLVIHAMDAFAGAIGVSDSDGKSTPVYSVCKPRQGLSDSMYYGRLLRHMALSGFIESLAKGIRERSTEFRWAEAGNVYLPVPPIAEQIAIAAFLHHETAQIDTLIAEQENLITLLAEKSRATISHAVTKGINPNAPMKDSRVAWLGEVPAHWEVVRIKRVISSIEQGWSPQCENFPVSSPDEWGVLKVGCVNGGVFRPIENKKLPPELEPVPAYSLKCGDLLISRANTRELVGSAAAVETDFDNLMLCDKLYRLRLNKARCTPSYLAAYLGTSQARSQIELEATGASSSMLNIGQSAILDMPAPMPSVTEQNEIQKFLRTEMARLDALNAAAKCSIILLKERRSALIAAAVTGQIDVRGTMPQTAIENLEATAA